MTSRRTVLQRCGALVGAASLAGCSGDPSETGTGTRSPAETDTDGGTPDGETPTDSLAPWARWAYEPGTFDQRYRLFPLRSTGIAGFQRNEGYIPDQIFDPLKFGLVDELPGIDRLSVERRIVIDTDAKVLLGSFGGDEIVASVRERERNDVITSAEGYRGYEVYVNEGLDVHYGVREGELLRFSTSGERERFETLVDVGMGEAPRAIGTNEHFGRLATAAGDPGTFFYVSVLDRPLDESEPQNKRFAGLRGSNHSLTIDGETTTGREVFLFETESDVDVSGVRTWLEYSRRSDTGGWPTGFESVSVERRDRVVVVTGSIPTTELSDSTI